MTLGDLIKKCGYTQKYVRAQLAANGVSRSKTHFNQWCNNHFAPKDEVVYEKLAIILEVNVNEIKKCFAFHGKHDIV